MQPQDHPESGAAWRRTLPRIFAPISIIATCLYLLFFTIEFVHWLHEKHEETDPPHYIVHMREAVGRQIGQVRAVPASLLADTLIADLSTFDCKWYLKCSPRPLQTVYDSAFPCPTCHIEISSFRQFVPPQLTFKIGGAPIPTFHTVFGTPHALRVVAVKVAAAGPWAIVMFLSCTIIYFGLALLSAARAKDVPPLIVLIVLTCSPLGITLLANLFQWSATRVFDGISWALSLLIMVIAYSSAISLAVALPHVWKAPREILEATELIRKA